MTDSLDGERAVRNRADQRAGELADSYREAGWEVLVLQPANVVPIPVGPAGGDGDGNVDGEVDADDTDNTDTDVDGDAGADVGIGFLLPREEFALIADIADRDPETEVVRGGRGEYAAVVVTLRDPDTGGALVIPLSFREPTATAMARAARARGRLDLIARPSGAERRVEIPLDPDAVLDGT